MRAGCDASRDRREHRRSVLTRASGPDGCFEECRSSRETLTEGDSRRRRCSGDAHRGTNRNHHRLPGVAWRFGWCGAASHHHVHRGAHGADSRSPALLARAGEAGPFAAEASDACKQGYRLGYRIEVSAKFTACDTLIHTVPSVAGLPSVRVEATVVWSSIPSQTYKKFGAGDAFLTCRGNSQDTRDETYYDAGLTTSGHWEFSRYVRNTQSTVARGDDPSLASRQGGIRQLRLDCVQLQDGGVQLFFYVDGDPISTHIDPEPLGLGLIGVGASSFTDRRLAATLRDLRVYGPSS